MVVDRKLEAVARAAWEADNAVAFALGELGVTARWDNVALALGELAVTARWDNQARHVREPFLKLVESCLSGDPPNSIGWGARNERRCMLFVGVVRCTAAALGMTIVYPDGVVRDWSQSQSKDVSLSDTVREFGTCAHPDDKTVPIGSGEGELWCAHCGAIYGSVSGDWSRAEIGQWAEQIQR